MRVLFGLGNPGRQYEFTRHNIGYIIVDYIAFQNKVPFKPGKGDYYFSEVRIAGERVLLVKPTTFMNRSGLAVHQVMKFFPVGVEDLLVVTDDYHLPFATVRFRPQGSEGGHNGLKSIAQTLGSNEFNRMRFGIGNDFDDSVDFVLSRFSKKELALIDDILPDCADAVQTWVREGIDKTMNSFNRSLLRDNSN